MSVLRDSHANNLPFAISPMKNSTTPSKAALSAPPIFSPGTSELLSSLHLEPPQTPDIVSGRGYSNEELDLVNELESAVGEPDVGAAVETTSTEETLATAFTEKATSSAVETTSTAEAASTGEQAAVVCNTDNFSDLEPFILHPTTLSFLPMTSFGAISQLSTAFQQHSLSAESFWYQAAHNLAHSHQLYLPYPQQEKILGSWKRIFFEQLFPARHKWSALPSVVGEDAEQENAPAPPPPSTDFKIQVASRFRPGERKKSAILLPLHQRLRLLRKQQKEASSKSASIGMQTPNEFIDPLMGGVMSDPVRLPSSQKICDRKIVLSHLRSSSTDPFDSSPLSPAQLIACDDLKQRITEFNANKQSSFFAEGDDDTSSFRVASDDVKALTEMGGDITPEILQALLDADRLETDIRMAEEQANAQDARKNRSKKFNKWGDEETVDENTPPPAAVPDSESSSGAPVHAAVDAKLSSIAKAVTEEEDLAKIVNGPQKRDARVLAVEKTRVLMHIDGRGIRPFLMSGGCFNEYSDQREVYAQAGRAPVVSALNGLNACLLAYGQTGSGKTHTMFGPENILYDCWQAASQTASIANTTVKDCVASVLACKKGEVGLAVRACAEICECLGLHEGGASDVADRNIVSTLSVQYVQIYNEQITCLLGSTNEVHMRGELMTGARSETITGLPRMLELLVFAEQNKKRASTAMNERSSRSHSILVFNIQQRNVEKDSLVSSCLHVVDLAGSERLKKSKVEGIHKSEAININKSLMTLGKCVSALVEKKSHVPYFESKLTSILRNSLGGNSRTTAIVACRMDDDNANETLQSLRFGERIAAITNTVAAAATNATDAVKAIDRALQLCETQLASLEKRNMTHLPMYNQVKEKFSNLQLRRGEIEK
jgi:hypothetical protein